MALRSSLALIGLMIASPVAAADLGASPGDLWRGPWIGAAVGVGRLGGTGPLASVSAGYDVRRGSIVLGIGADLSAGDLDARRFGGRYEVEALGAIRARIGYAFDRFVAYGSAGAAFASAEFARAGESDRALHAGWTVGAGFEAALGGGVSAKLEYIYVDLDRRAFDAGGAADFGPSGGQIRGGFNYRF